MRERDSVIWTTASTTTIWKNLLSCRMMKAAGSKRWKKLLPQLLSADSNSFRHTPPDTIPCGSQIMNAPCVPCAAQWKPAADSISPISLSTQVSGSSTFTPWIKNPTLNTTESSCSPCSDVRKNTVSTSVLRTPLPKTWALATSPERLRICLTFLIS